jgi:kynurenine formamidase
VAALEGVPMLSDSYEITPQDLEQALARQKQISPNPDPDLSPPVHQVMLVVHGIQLLENVKLDELSAGRIHEFAFVVQPLEPKGGTGSTVAPIAIR